MHRCLVVMLILLVSLPVRANQSDWINWLAKLSDHGIVVESSDWKMLARGASHDQLQHMVTKYARYMDTGQLDRHLFQSAWKLEEKPQSLPVRHFTLSSLESLTPKLPEYALLQHSLKQLRYWQRVAGDQFPDNLILFEGDQHPVIKLLNQWLWDLDLADRLPDHEYTQAHKDVLTQVQLQFNLGPMDDWGLIPVRLCWPLPTTEFVYSKPTLNVLGGCPLSCHTHISR